MKFSKKNCYANPLKKQIKLLNKYEIIKANKLADILFYFDWLGVGGLDDDDDDDDAQVSETIEGKAMRQRHPRRDGPTDGWMDRTLDRAAVGQQQAATTHCKLAINLGWTKSWRRWRRQNDLQQQRRPQL